MGATLIKTGPRDRTYYEVSVNNQEIGFIVEKDNGRFSAFMGKHNFGGSYIGQYDTLMEAKSAVEEMSEVMR